MTPKSNSKSHPENHNQLEVDQRVKRQASAHDSNRDSNHDNIFDSIIRRITAKEKLDKRNKMDVNERIRRADDDLAREAGALREETAALRNQARDLKEERDLAREIARDCGATLVKHKEQLHRAQPEPVPPSVYLQSDHQRC